MQTGSHAHNAGSADRSAPRIVVRSVNWLGDAVMAAPALQRLRERMPDAHIALLTPEKLADLWRHHPAVDAVLSFPTGPPGARRGLFALAGELRASRFDLALVLPNSPRSALEAWLARIPRRVGYARPWRNWLLTRAVPTRPGHVKMHKRSVSEIKRLIERPNPATRIQSPSAHQVHEYLFLVAAAFGADPTPLAPRLVVQQREIDEALRKFQLAADRCPIIGLIPGAEYGPAKRWPEERFVAAARQIHDRTRCLWLLLGAKGDVEIADRISAGLGLPAEAFRNLAGRTSLGELCALLKLCRAVLTNDTGAMHLGAACGTPVVAPFGSTSPELTQPGLPGDSCHRILRSDAACSPCFLRRCPIDFRCMTGIGVDEVVEAVLSLV